MPCAAPTWETNRYAGYTGQTVKVQQRTSYVDAELAVTNSSGIATSEVTATVDICFRDVFAETTTAPPVTCAGDCVDVV